MSIEVKNLHFSYENKNILNGINFTAHACDIVGILGPNGCGKSTLLKNILGFFLSESGANITIHGKKLNEYTQKELACLIGFVPQKSMLQMPLPVEDVIIMGRYSHLKSFFNSYSKEDFDKLHQISEALDVRRFFGRIANSLSGGEFQRVMLARALIGEPKILILDEPTSALDLNYALQMLTLCENIIKKERIIGLVVLHDLNLAGMFCNRALLLQNGRIKYDGSPRELFTQEILKDVYNLNCDVLLCGDYPVIIGKK